MSLGQPPDGDVPRDPRRALADLEKRETARRVVPLARRSPRRRMFALVGRRMAGA
jgi:hypothetical protein